uniref:Uncharacterized protein n=1 Tax=Leptocylindrus danicus TaxID=163516 RepID=A0A7S2KSL8_9STRA|eukprot:CAMPEP_0116039714 /NCGR_PEP_ID=MMETSP0321-20121206/23802_1 /TAXON_ID=163516 /ORGANISM="Leptocylindrus danicus var. danicus, Strain B650" /LENGTH=261 /DNA_ID=CAMNT_0003519139 /DNA_START=63 /DNA_END=848 /DNA_ORIENTATION=+
MAYVESSDEAEFEDDFEEEQIQQQQQQASDEPGDDDDNDFIDDEEEGGGGDNDDEDDDDSDDDMPIAALKKKTAASSKKKATPAKKTPAKKAATKKTTPAKKKQLIRKKSSSASITASSELYAKSDKGKLVQSLLCRWWYAIQWPEQEILEAPVPKNCDTLPGFPGVYVCTKGENVGKIYDHRNKNTCPNFLNFARKSSEELQELLLKAIEKQRQVLIEHEGQGTDTEKGLKDLEKWTKKLNCKKADKDAVKVLKAAGLDL